MMGRLKRMIAAMLTAVMLFGVIPVQPVQAASISYYNVKVTNVTSDNATLDFCVNNPSKVGIKYVGFYLYNSANRKIGKGTGKFSKTIKQNQFRTTLNIKNYWKALSPNTCYKYRLFVKTAWGFEYKMTQMFSFRTGYTKPSFTNVSLSKLTRNSATVQFYVKNPSGLRITAVGFRLYDNIDTTPKIMRGQGYDRINYTYKQFKAWFDTDLYIRRNRLQPGRTYYYQFYVVLSNGQTFNSGYYSFRTYA